MADKFLLVKRDLFGHTSVRNTRIQNAVENRKNKDKKKN